MKENDISETIDFLRSLSWAFQRWKPTPALINKNGFPTHQYVGQSFDPAYFTIDPIGWTHDHCVLCSKAICEDQEDCEVSGFTSENQWLCESCYNSTIKAC